MKNQIEFRYFSGNEAEMFTFYRIPKALVTNEIFNGISTDAKLLYGLMLDRMSVSMKNGWIDRENHVYIYFSIEDIMKLLCCGKNKALKTMAELDAESGIGLVERRKQGLGKPALIYVKNFIIDEAAGAPEVYNSNFQKFTFQTSGGPFFKPQEVYISNPNKNKYSNTEESNISSYRGLENKMIRNDEKLCRSSVSKNIDLDLLKLRNPNEEELIDGICSLIVESMMSTSTEIVIASSRYPSELVKAKFARLRMDHVEYVLQCLRSNTTKVKNYKKYILAALFNAPDTIAGYYAAEVNHDMAQMGVQ